MSPLSGAVSLGSCRLTTRAASLAENATDNVALAPPLEDDKVNQSMTETAERIQLDTSETFPHLTHAPIIEAVIDLKSDLEHPLEEKTARSILEPKLAGYTFFDSQSNIKHQVTFKERGEVQRAVHEVSWKGVRFRSNDQSYIVQFNRDGFAASRLHPYENWEKFTAESFRLWHIFCEITKPKVVERIGVRFINAIRLPPGELMFSEYIHFYPPKFQVDLKLPFIRLAQEESMQVPASPYGVNITRAIRPPEQDEEKRLSIILDIDVYAQVPLQSDDSTLMRHLTDLRWLKNKVFFGSITENTVKLMQ
jgi:uncharacterized protein (TIGR04255 family)